MTLILRIGFDSFSINLQLLVLRTSVLLGFLQAASGNYCQYFSAVERRREMKAKNKNELLLLQ